MRSDARHRTATVAVVGGGQAGLSAGYHLQRRGFTSAVERAQAARRYVVLDAEPAPGGVWRHRWESQTMTTVNGIFDLPGFPAPLVDPDEPSRQAVPATSRRSSARSAWRSSDRCA